MSELREPAVDVGGGRLPGEQPLRLSMDLATGTAGVLLAMAMAGPGRPASLPLLDSHPTAAGSYDTEGGGERPAA